MSYQDSLGSWTNRLFELSEIYLRDLTPENSVALREFFETHKQMGPQISWRDILKEISSSQKGKLVAIALYVCQQKTPAKDIWNRYIDTESEFTQLQVYGLLISNGYKNYLALYVTSHFSASGSTRDSDFIIGKVKEELKGQDSPDPNLVRFLSSRLTKNSPINYLVISLLHSSIGMWKERFGWIFEKCHLDVQKTASVIPPEVPREILGLLILEYQASHGNIAAFESLLEIGKVAAKDSHLVSVPIWRNLVIDLALIQIEKSIITPTILDALLVATLGNPSLEIVKKLGHLQNVDPISRAKIFNLLEVTRQRALLISFSSSFDIGTLTDIEYKLLLKAAQSLMNVDLLMKLNACTPIEDENLIMRLSAKMLGDGQKEVGMQLFLSRKLKLSEPESETFTLKFLSLLDRQNLLEYDLENPIQNGELVFRIANYLNSKGTSSGAIDPYLHRAVALGSSSAARLYTEIHNGETFERETLKLASKDSGAYLAKREYAKLLILDGDIESASEYATAAAYHDDQAAHLMMHVLGRDIAHWAQLLERRDVRFIASEYEDIFRKNGLTLLKSSELETNSLHDIYLLKEKGVSRRKIAAGDYVIEKWICNKAILDIPRKTWAISACENHREDVTQFSNIGMIRQLADIHWEETLTNLLPHSRPFNESGRGYLRDALESQPLRSWQKRAIDAWVQHGRQGIIEAATGSGKSKIGALAALEAMDEGFAVVIVVPTRILQQQWIKDYFSDLWNLPGKKIWTMGNKDEEGGYVRTAENLRPGTITVAIVNTFCTLEDMRTRVGVETLIIADEVHNYSGEKYRKILHPSFSRRLGLTATLQTPEGRYPILSNYFGGHPVFTYGFDDAVRDGVISPYNLLLIGVPMEPQILTSYTNAYRRMVALRNELVALPEVSGEPSKFIREIDRLKSASRYLQLIASYEAAFEESDKYLRESKSKANALRTLADFVKNRGNTMVFCDFNLTSENINIIFKDRGISTAIINQHVKPKDRREIFDQFELGKVEALLSPKALDEGVDIKHASVGIFAGTSRRRLQIIQRLGRVLRINTGKLMPLIVIPVALDTEEDPEMHGNGHLEKSSFNIVYEQAVKRGYIHVDKQDEILKFLTQI